MAPTWPRHRLALSLAALCLWVVWFVGPGLLPGRSLLGVDLLHRFPPWDATVTADWEASNHLLFDQASQFYPWRLVTRRLESAGLPPLWNPYAGAGSPLLANEQSATLAPVELVVGGIDPARAPGFAAAIRLLVAGGGMLLVAVELGLGPLAALFAAVAFLGSGSIALLLYHPNSNVSMWLPLAALLSLRLARQGDLKIAAFLALVLGAQLLGGHPETSVYVSLASVLCFALGWVGAGPDGAATGVPAARGGWRAPLLLAAAHVAGAALAAPQILPFLEYLREGAVLSHRSGERFFNPPLCAAGLAVPELFGTPDRPNTYFGPRNYHAMATQYTGLSTLVLGLLAAAGALRDRGAAGDPRRRLALLALVVLALVAVLLVYPTPLWRLAGLLTLFQVAANVTGLTLLWCFALALLGAFGLEALAGRRGAARGGEGRGGEGGGEDDGREGGGTGARPGAGAVLRASSAVEPRMPPSESGARLRTGPPDSPTRPAGSAGREPSVLAALVAAGALIALAAGLLLPLARERLLEIGGERLAERYAGVTHARPIEYYIERLPLVVAALRATLIRTGLLAGALALLLIGPGARAARRAALLAPLLLLHLAADLGHFGRGYVPAMAATDVFPAPLIDGFEALPGGVHRVLPTGRAFPPNTLAAYGVEDFRLHDAVGSAALGRFEAAMSAAPFFRRPLASYDRALLDVAGIDVVAIESSEPVPSPSRFGFRAGRNAPGSDVSLLSNERAWPRAFFAPRARRAESDSAALAAARGIAVERAVAIAGAGERPDPPREVVITPARTGAGVASPRLWSLVRLLWPRPDVLPGPPLERRGQVGGIPASGAPPAGLTETPLVVTATLEAPEDGWLVLLDQDYPGWEVRVDGEAAGAARAYGLFRAVPVAAGRHQVAWRYRPASFAWGIAVALPALAAVAAVLIAAAFGGGGAPMKPRRARNPTATRTRKTRIEATSARIPST